MRGDRALHPLLSRCPLRVGESLSSLLVRLATRNRYESPAILARLCLEDGEDTSAGFPFHPATFERIAQLTQLEVAQLYLATPHRFAQVFTRPGQETPPASLPDGQTVPRLAQSVGRKQLRPETAAQYCSLCLRQHPYHRLIWMASVVTTCLHHRCLLVSGCPHCQRPLTIAAVVDRHCQLCGTDLRVASVIPVADDPLGLAVQALTQAWLTGAVPSCSREQGLPDQPPAVLYALWEGLGSTVMKVKADWAYLHSVDFAPPTLPHYRADTHRYTPAEIHIIYTTAFKALLQWPVGFHEWLEAYRQRDGRQLSRGLQADFYHLYREWLEKRWRHAAFGFVQAAFNQYLVNHYPRANAVAQSSRYRSDPDFAQQFAYIPLTEAASLLGQPPAYVYALLAAGVLTPSASQDYARSQPFVEREAVLNYRRQSLSPTEL